MQQRPDLWFVRKVMHKSGLTILVPSLLTPDYYTYWGHVDESLINWAHHDKRFDPFEFVGVHGLELMEYYMPPLEGAFVKTLRDNKL